jgi:hypothetical protein
MEDIVRKIRLLVIMAIAVAVLSTAAFATAAWLKTFNSTYSPKADSAIVKAKCQLCHTKGVALNPYGMSLKGKAISAASLKSVEKMDADKDKISNIAEIKAGSLPGDAKSKPAAKKPAKPKKK